MLARWLGPADRGLLGLMLTIAGLGMTLAGIGLPLAVMYFASRKASPGALLGNSFAFGALLAILFVPSFLIFHEQIGDVFSRGRGGMLWVLVAGLIPLTFLDWTTHNQILGRLRFGLFNVLTVVSKALYLVAIIVLVGVLGGGVAGALIATAVGSLLMIGGSLPSILKLERVRLDKGLFRDTIRYGRNVQIGTIFQTVNFRFDVIVLQFFRPLREVGYYVVAQLIAELVITFAGAFQSSVQPLVAHYEGDERQQSTTAVALRHHGILAFAATLGNAVVGPLIILFAFGSSYRAAVIPMLVLLPGMWFLGTGTVAAGDLRGRGRPGLSSAVAGLAALVTIALDLVLIPLFGVLGAALASVAAYVVYGIVSLVAVSRESGIAVSELVIPTRADLAMYPATFLSLLSRIRPPSQPTT
jgi:O-antigen/teichoic acid export membrane protein